MFQVALPLKSYPDGFDPWVKKGCKTSDAAAVGAYVLMGNIWDAADFLGISGQTVSRQLKKAGYKVHRRFFTEQEIEEIKKAYSGSPKRGDLNLKKLAKKLDRGPSEICGIAAAHGLTSRTRKLNHSENKKKSQRIKKWHSENEHPRGMLGKKHTPETLAVISSRSAEHWKNLSPKKKRLKTMRMLKTKRERGDLNVRRNVTWKCGFREIGGINKYYRSRWEANYARYLQWLKERGDILSWQHEPRTFWFEAVRRGTRSYLPDFLVINKDNSEEYHEVKGWMDAASKTKLRRMAKYYPEVKLLLIDAKYYKSLEIKLSRVIPGWESAVLVTIERMNNSGGSLV